MSELTQFAFQGGAKIIFGPPEKKNYPLKVLLGRFETKNWTNIFFAILG